MSRPRTLHAQRASLTAETDIATRTFRDITVIGGSAGAIGPLQTLLEALPADYPAAIVVVIHLSPESPSVLHRLLARRSRLPVLAPTDGMSLRPGSVIVAPPDLHVVLSRDAVHLSHGPRENRHRPSVDVLFRSAAMAFGARVTGVVMSGMLDDGAAGLWAIGHRGGATVVQDPQDAEFPDMPRNAIERRKPDLTVAVANLGAALDRLAREPVEAQASEASPNLASEVRMAASNRSEMADLDAIGHRVPYTCPECGGALWQVEDPGPRFRCHVGHAYSLKSLASEQTERVEAALWAALRGLEENERLARQLAHFAAERGSARSAARHNENAVSYASHADVLRALLAANAGPASNLQDAAD